MIGQKCCEVMVIEIAGSLENQNCMYWEKNTNGIILKEVYFQVLRMMCTHYYSQFKHIPPERVNQMRSDLDVCDGSHIFLTGGQPTSQQV